MKNIPRVLSGFKRLNDECFSTLASTVYNAMLSNDYFDTPVPDLPDLKMAEGNLPTLLSSGFSVSSNPRTYYVPPIVQSVRLSDGRQSGQIVLRFEMQENVRLYEYCYAHEKDEAYEHIWSEIFKTSSSTGNLISGAIPGVFYFARVRANNTKGIGEWSEPVSMMAR